MRGRVGRGVVVVVVVVGTAVVARREPPRAAFPLLPPPPNCCVIVGKSLALIGRPRSVDRSFRSLLMAWMSCWPRAISDLDSCGWSVVVGSGVVDVVVVVVVLELVV